MTRRMLSIWLPELAIERWLRSRDGVRQAAPDTDSPAPLAVLTETGARGVLITAATVPARRLGIAPGMRLTDARTICPALGAAHHDRTGDAACMEMMADAMLRFTPWVALDPTDGLMLDITGCAHLAGGEAKLANSVRAVFARAGFTARTGIAQTQGAAWALARYAKGNQILTEDMTQSLKSLPVAALRLSPETTDGLTQLGLKQIGDLIPLDRASLMRRFPPSQNDPGPVARLDQALGRRDEPLSPRTEAPDYRVHTTPLEPLIDLAGIRHHFGDLLAGLTGILSKDGRGARRLVLHAFRSDGPVLRIHIGLARASREHWHISRLFEEKFDVLDPGFGIDTLMLTADVTEPMTALQESLESGHETTGSNALERLVDRVANRLGPDSIHKLAPVESHLPDRAVKRMPDVTTSEQTSSNVKQLESAGSSSFKGSLTMQGGKIKGGWEGITQISEDPSKTPQINKNNQTLRSKSPCAELPLRPLTLLAKPEPIAVMAEIPEGPPLTFRWRRVLHRVTRATGPERIAPEWWRDLADNTRTRDYYAIEDAGGGRYWLFRDGLYHESHARGTPEWFLHGVFA